MEVNIAAFADYVSAAPQATLAGIRNLLICSAFPAVVPQLFYYVAMEFDPNECSHLREFRLEILDQDGLKVFSSGVFNSPINQDPFTKMGHVHLTFHILGLQIPKAGTYIGSLWQGDDLIKNSRIVAIQGAPQIPKQP